MLKTTPLHATAPASGPLDLAEILFALSRRHELSFTVVALEIAADSAGPGCPDSGQLDSAIAAAIRRTDLLIRWESLGRRHYAVFCPSTNAQGAKELVARIWAAIARHRARCGAATFPDDALVLDDLIDAALFDALGPERPTAIDGIDAEVIRRSRWGRLDLTSNRRGAAVAKRAFDLCLLVLAAPLWLPALALVAFAIKVSAPRLPVLFTQERTGRGGRRFRMYKFRTMVPDAEALKAAYSHLNQLAWPDFKIERDPRVTRLGRFLRKTSLDELPQVLNVLRGDMSWVGPRPTSFGPETYAIWQTARLDVVPGVTGLWQVSGRAHTDFDERLRIDMDYIDRRSLWLDLKILLLTAREVFHPRGGC